MEYPTLYPTRNGFFEALRDFPMTGRKEFPLVGWYALKRIRGAKNLCVIFRKIKFSIFEGYPFPHPTPTEQERLYTPISTPFRERWTPIWTPDPFHFQYQFFSDLSNESGAGSGESAFQELPYPPK
jgi:hypothetical protein